MDDKLVQGIFARCSTFEGALRCPLEYLPTYTTFFGDDNRPATLILLGLCVYFLFGLFAYKGPLAETKAKAAHLIRCHIALIVLSMSICFPMPDELLSTLRCYAIILLLIPLSFLSASKSKAGDLVFCFHFLCTCQLLLLPGFWNTCLGGTEEEKGGRVLLAAFCFIWFGLGNALTISQENCWHEGCEENIEEAATAEENAARKTVDKGAAEEEDPKNATKKRDVSRQTFAAQESAEGGLANETSREYYSLGQESDGASKSCSVYELTKLEGNTCPKGRAKGQRKDLSTEEKREGCEASLITLVPRPPLDVRIDIDKADARSETLTAIDSESRQGTLNVYQVSVELEEANGGDEIERQQVGRDASDDAEAGERNGPHFAILDKPEGPGIKDIDDLLMHIGLFIASFINFFLLAFFQLY